MAPPTQGSHSSLPKIFQILTVLSLVWLFFIVFQTLKIFPLNSYVLISILPTQIKFPTLFILLFYLKGLALWLGIMGGSYAYGIFLLRFIEIEWASPLEKGVFAIALGHAITSYFLLALACAHWLYPPVLFSFWGLGCMAFIFILNLESERNPMGKAAKELRSFIFMRENPLWMRVFLWIFLGLGFMMTLVPELFYDALVYHLGAPNLYLQEHGLTHIPGVLSKVPMIWQSLYLFGLSLQDEMIPKLIHWSNGLLILLASGTFFKRWNIPFAGFFCGLLFLSVPMVQMNLWTCGTDIGGAFFGLLAVYALCVQLVLTCAERNQSSSVKIVETNVPYRTQGWTILCAIFAAFSFGSKYQGGFTALILFFLTLSLQLISKPKNTKAILRDSAIFMFIFLFLISPWLLKNLWDTGNPLFPFLGSLFKKLHLQKVELDPEQWVTFLNENRRFIVSSWSEYWKLPWKLTFQDPNQSSLSYPGPLFLALLPLNLVLIQLWEKKWIQGLFLFTILFFIFSFHSTHLTRYHLQGYPALCLLYGAAFGLVWSSRNFFMKGAMALALIFLLLENLQVGNFIIENSYHPWNVLLGIESRQDYRAYSHPGLNPYPANVLFRWMEKNLGPKSRTLFLGDSKPYDLKLPYLYTDVHGKNPFVEWCQQSRSAQELFLRLKEAGITHFLVNFEEARRTYSYKMLKWDPESLKVCDDFWRQYVSEIHREFIPEQAIRQGGILLLYEIKETPSIRSAQVPEPNPLIILEKIQKS